MKVQVFESFSAIPAAVSDHFAFLSKHDFFSSLDWFSCLYETALNQSLRPRIYCLCDGQDAPAGMLVCGVSPNGRTLQSLTNFYTIEYGLLTPNDQTSPLAAILDYISAEKPRWDNIELRFIDREFAEANDLELQFKQRGFSASSYFMYENWYIKMSGRDFETYYASRPSRLRNTTKRKEKKLAKSHAYSMAFHTTNGPALDKATQDYITIYNKSWKKKEPFPEFTPQLISLCAGLGILRLGVLYIDNMPAAAQIWINAGKRAIIYKLAYDEAYSNFSPGSILSRELFRLAIDEDKVEEIDYGIGSENYKKEWMEAAREKRGIQAFNRKTLRGLSMSTKEFLKSLARKAHPRTSTSENKA